MKRFCMNCWDEVNEDDVVRIGLNDYCSRDCYKVHKASKRNSEQPVKFSEDQEDLMNWENGD